MCPQSDKVEKLERSLGKATLQSSIQDQAQAPEAESSQRPSSHLRGVSALGLLNVDDDRERQQFLSTLPDFQTPISDAERHFDYSLCTRCRDINFDKYLDGPRRLVDPNRPADNVIKVPIGTVARIRRDMRQCAFCRLVGHGLFKDDDFLFKDEQATPEDCWECELWVTRADIALCCILSRREAIDLCASYFAVHLQNMTTKTCTHDVIHIGRRQDSANWERPLFNIALIPNGRADYDQIKLWIGECSQDHQRCSTKAKQPPRKPQPCWRFIDVKSRRIVTGNPEVDRFVALSYIWGDPPSASVGLPNNQGTQPLLARPTQDQNLVLPHDLPQVIDDALTVCQELGEELLWVDRYCIDQTDLADKQAQVEAMDSIYSNARLTIVANSRSFTYAGLPGVREGSRTITSQHTQLVRRKNYVAADFRILRRNIHQYSDRNLTHDSDALKAFSGVLNRYTNASSVNFWAGLPTQNFIARLMWFGRGITTRQTADIPSWSWARYKGQIRYEDAPLETIGLVDTRSCATRRTDGAESRDTSESVVYSTNTIGGAQFTSWSHTGPTSDASHPEGADFLLGLALYEELWRIPGNLSTKAVTISHGPKYAQTLGFERPNYFQGTVFQQLARVQRLDGSPFLHIDSYVARFRLGRTFEVAIGMYTAMRYDTKMVFRYLSGQLGNTTSTYQRISRIRARL
ncbi:heterokaryon incompatibility protein-domain-containing protein [Leptodontidium sp. 2 PMI_412]|nr:heterokaryon incompatibility protein-domain-containing protein [Leptodontidium sp. 2 PMI_412]